MHSQTHLFKLKIYPFYIKPRFL